MTVRRTPLALAGAGVFASLLLALVFQGSFGYEFVIIVATVWIGFPVMLLGLATLCVALLRKQADGIFHGFRILAVTLGMVAVLWTGAYLGRWLNTRTVARTKAFVEACVPLLDAHRERVGQYPESLTELGLRFSPPRRTADYLQYSREEETFFFEFPDGAKMMEGWRFDGRTRQWGVIGG
jgi:hypothetical protein